MNLRGLSSSPISGIWKLLRCFSKSVELRNGLIEVPGAILQWIQEDSAWLSFVTDPRETSRLAGRNSRIETFGVIQRRTDNCSFFIHSQDTDVH